MTCAAVKPTFRLLDQNVGWDYDPRATQGLSGFDPPDSLCLSAVNPGAVDPNAIFACLPPPRLSRGCDSCEWYLLTQAPPESLLLFRDSCHASWKSPAPQGDWPRLKDAVAVAAWRDYVAVADAGSNSVFVFAQRGSRVLAQIPVTSPGPLTFSSDGNLLVTSRRSREISCYSVGGDFLGRLRVAMPSETPHGESALNDKRSVPHILALDSTGGIWLVLRKGDSFTLWLADKGAASFTQQMDCTALQEAFPASGITLASDDGFCFDEDAKHGLDAATCYSWYGRPLRSCEIKPFLPPQLQTQGQMITLEIDSGVPRCEWHRVRLDADVPVGTTIVASVATTESLNPTKQGDASRDPGWTAFPAGTPHFSDWTSGPSGSVDFLIAQPPGRYVYLRLRMKGECVHTPILRRVRIDFPRATSIDRLPNVYRETPRAEDFTKRFLSIFDSAIADLDAMIERYPALLSATGVPDQLLPWLGSFFDVGFDPTWDSTKRRAIIKIIPQLYRRRGTSAAMQLAIKTIFGVEPAITEFSSVGPWGSISDRRKLATERCHPGGSQLETQRNVQLGSTRLFGRNATRLRLGHSALGSTPIRSFGNPDMDPFSSGAFRLQISVPPFEGISPQQMQRLSNLIDAQKPAHTVASLRVGGTGFLLGTWSAVGIDSAFAPLAPPILGAAGSIRLNRMSVLAGGSGGRLSDQGLGRNSIVGSQTIAG
jgi:phage tail-like protein